MYIEDEDLHNEDNETWEAFSKSIKKLNILKPKHNERAATQLKVNVKVNEKNSSDYGKNYASQSLKTHAQLEIDDFKGIDKNLYRNIVAGKVSPECRLDLHGLTRIEAEEAVIASIQKWYNEGRRLTLIITGKGKEGNPNSIKNNLIKFLNSQTVKDMILFASTASRIHGGVGAFYVFLRRR